MIRIRDQSYVPASPQRIWAWFAGLEEHYVAWHPAHLDFRAITGSPVRVGSICRFDLRLGGRRLRMRSRVEEAEPHAYLRHGSIFPVSLLGAGGSFTIRPVDGGSELIADVWIGYHVPVAGPLLDRLLGRTIPVPVLRRHMAEESRQLARILGPGTGSEDGDRGQ